MPRTTTDEDADTIEVAIDSGANCQSNHTSRVGFLDLGFDSRAEWDAATEEQKYAAVAEYWQGMGYPEITWRD